MRWKVPAPDTPCLEAIGYDFLYLFGIKKGTILIIANIPNLRKEISESEPWFEIRRKFPKVSRGSKYAGNFVRSKRNSKDADLEVRWDLFRGKRNPKDANLEVRWDLFQNFAVLKQILFYDKIGPKGVSNLLFQNEVLYDLWLCTNFH